MVEIEGRRSALGRHIVKQPVAVGEERLQVLGYIKFAEVTQPVIPVSLEIADRPTQGEHEATDENNRRGREADDIGRAGDGKKPND